MPPAELSPRFTRGGGLHLRDPTDRDDVQTTMAIWQRAGLSPREAWRALTGQDRAYIGTPQIYEFMLDCLGREQLAFVFPDQPTIDTGGGKPVLEQEHLGARMDWFRSHHGAPTDPKWLMIARRAGCRPIEVAAIWWALLDYASQHEDRGSIAGFDRETLAEFYDLEEITIDAVVAALEQKGLLAGSRIASWSRRNPLREDDTAAERKRRQRERERQAGSHAASRDVTQGHDRGEEIREEEIREGPPLPPRRAGRARVPAGAPLSPDFVVPEDWVAEARAQREELGRPVADLAAEAAKFENRYRGKPLEDPHGRWLNWAIDAKAGPGSAPATGPAEAVAGPAAGSSAPTIEHRLGPPGDRLRAAVDPVLFRQWLAGLEIASCSGGVLRLSAPDRFARNWISANCEAEILRAWRAEGIPVKHVEIETRSAVVDRTLTAPPAAAVAPAEQLAAAGRSPKPTRRREPGKQREILMPLAGGAATDNSAPARSPPVDQVEPDVASERRRAAG